jgi:hypothetical protein
MVVTVEERISIVKRELKEARKQRSLAKAKQHNTILKLHEQYRQKLGELHQFMACLSRKKKQQQNDMKKYRQVIAGVFADMYLPAFCVAKQAFLLRAVHTSKLLCPCPFVPLLDIVYKLWDCTVLTMRSNWLSLVMCFDQALFVLGIQCATELKDYDRTIHELQEETASISQDLLNQLMIVERHIHQCEQGLQEAQNRITIVSKLQLHRASSEEGLDDVPLEDDSIRSTLYLENDVVSPRIVPKRHVSSDRTLDTTEDLTYVDMSSCDGDEPAAYRNVSSSVVSYSRQRSIPKFVGRS